MSFLNATWYGGDYETELLTATGITEAQYTALMDTADPDSFGSAVAQACQDVATQYSCTDIATGSAATNCTSDELGSLQWGSLEVTRNPNPVWNSIYEYFPVADTVYGWGPYEPYSLMTASVEYPQTTGALESSWTYIERSVALIMTSKELDGGLNSFFSW